MFKVEVIGNLGADYQIRDANGKKFAVVRIAHTDKWTDQEEKTHETTVWIDGIINNVDSKVLPFLKAGVKVFARGNASLRVYSSPKDRMMKAGCQINIQEIELCGGQSDLVPRQIVNPDDGTIHEVVKYYWCDVPTKGMKSKDLKGLVDVRGGQYVMDPRGFIAPIPHEEAQEETQAEKKD